tara:strand:+ start:753 stop:1253 length:501 start_codon:yes stop_codon:yes gene_type:complete
MKYLHKTLIEDLTDLCGRLDDHQYCFNSKLLNGAFIGLHLRHSAEFYLCLFNGIPTQTVNYDERKRDLLIETDRKYAIKILSDLSDQLKHIQPSFALQLFSNETEAKEKPFVTYVDRELLYCLDHANHHQVLIKIGLKELQIVDLVGDDFGVAYSTLRYRGSLYAN